MSTHCYCLLMTTARPAPRGADVTAALANIETRNGLTAGSIRYYGDVIPAVRKANGDVVAQVDGRTLRIASASRVAGTFKALDEPLVVATARALQVVEAAAASHAEDVAEVARLEALLAVARANAAASAQVLAEARRAL